MALLAACLWRFLLLLVHANRAAVSWLRVRLRSVRSRLWELLLPAALLAFPDLHKDVNGRYTAGRQADSRRNRWLDDGKALEKLPVHVGLLVAEEELSYADISSLVVWCMAVGVSWVSVYDHHGVCQKNNSRLMEEIVRKQQELLCEEGSEYSVEFLNTNNSQHNVVSCRPMLKVKVLSPDDGKQSIVQAAQQLCRSVENKERTSKDISVSMLDIILRESKSLPDPELVVKFGPVNSTLGFLPWHIRLTEFISLPSHRNVAYEDLLVVLQQYSSCQQRLGQ